MARARTVDAIGSVARAGRKPGWSTPSCGRGPDTLPARPLPWNLQDGAPSPAPLTSPPSSGPFGARGRRFQSLVTSPSLAWERRHPRRPRGFPRPVLWSQPPVPHPPAHQDRPERPATSRSADAQHPDLVPRCPLPPDPSSAETPSRGASGLGPPA